MALIVHGKLCFVRRFVVSGIVLTVAGPVLVGLAGALGLLGAFGPGGGALGWTVAIASFVGLGLMLRGYIPRPATLRFEEAPSRASAAAPFRSGFDTLLVPSWRKPIRLAAELLQLGPWMQPGVGTSQGVLIELTGEGGRLVVGARGHTGDGYELSATPRTRIDFELTTNDFDAMLAALHLTEGARGPLVVECMKNRMSVTGAAANVVPWLVTMGVCAIVGIALKSSGLERLRGGLAMEEVVMLLLVACGLGYTVVNVQRSQAPRRRLVLEPLGVTLIGQAGEVLARTPWDRVRARRLAYTFSTRGGYTMPVLELAVGDTKPLRMAVWDASLAWNDPRVESQWFAPDLLVGAPVWPRLVATLQARARLV